MEVVHPKEGTVYWEGPVEVRLVAEFSGECQTKNDARGGNTANPLVCTLYCSA